MVVGIINDTQPDGVFTPKILGHVYELTEFAKTLQWEDKDNPDRFNGVIEPDMISPCRIDHISQAGPGTIRFDRLMPLPPTTRKGALAVRDRIHIVNR